MTTTSSPSGAHQTYSMELAATDDTVNFEHGYGGKVEVAYVNNLDCDVWVADRLGGVVKVPSTGRWSNHFCVQIIRRHGNGTTVTLKRPVREMAFGSARETTVEVALKENYLKRDANQWSVREGRTKDLRLNVTREMIEKLGFSFYHPESDLVISLTEERAVHPGSPMERMKTHRETICAESAQRGVPLKLGITIIDNAFRISDKFVYLLGEVHRITPIRDLTREEGIYVYRDAAVTDTGVLVNDHLQVYPIDEESFNKLGFFKSYQAALHWVNELKENSEIRLAQKKAELLETKVVTEKTALKRKDRYDERGTKRKDQYEEKGTRRKDHYEEVSTRRKDSSDELKWILGTVATLLGIAALLGRK